MGVERTGPVCATVRVKMGWGDTFRVLLSSCRHHDHPHADREMERRHLDEAAKEGAGIIDLGDLFCAMQGRMDPRRSPDGKREEHRGSDNYLGLLVKEAGDWYAPWAPHWLVAGTGNHEASVARMCDYNLSAGFVERLRETHGSPVVGMGYRFWVRFLFDVAGHRASRRMICLHGSGGGGAVTKGAIQEHRRSAVYANADIVASGHIHERRSTDHDRLWLNDAGREEQITQLHVQVPTYKNEVRETGGGWAIERELNPKPMGAVWLDFEARGNKLTVDARRAQ